MTTKGDIGAIFDELMKRLTELNYNEESSTWPTEMEFKRGKKGMFAKNLLEVKTVLKVSLRQASDNVNMLFEYKLGIPSSYVNKDDNEVIQEFIKLKHEMVGAAPSHSASSEKLCDVCLNPFVPGENFCRTCGRSANRQKVEAPTQAQAQTPEQPIDVSFDPNRVAFGQKIVDDTLYGGIPKNSVMLITAPACEEKDLIVTRFMETGLDQSEIVVSISSDSIMDQNSKAVLNQAFYQVICNPQAELVASQGNAENTVMVKGVERLTELSVALTTLLNNISRIPENIAKPKRLVVDILSDTLLSNQSVNTRKWLRETITKFKARNFTILSILNPHMHAKEEVQALLDLFDGQIELYEKDVEGYTKMYMHVKRMKNSRYSTRETELIRENMWIQDKA